MHMIIEKVATQLFNSSVAYELNKNIFHSLYFIHKNIFKTEKFLSYGVAIDFSRHINRLLNALKFNNPMMEGAELVKMLSCSYKQNENSEKSRSNQ